MACPFFRPTRPMGSSMGRAPLGGMFHGDCERHGAGEPKLCNFGYARGLCADFADESAADAVRFSVAGNADGVIRLVWILEKNHAPMEHGVLEYRESTGEFALTLQGAMGVQARMFVENYCRADRPPAAAARVGGLTIL